MANADDEKRAIMQAELRVDIVRARGLVIEKAKRLAIGGKDSEAWVFGELKAAVDILEALEERLVRRS